MNIAFIPARCGSKEIELKNIKPFCGKPLIFWNLQALQNSKNIDVIYVATDCSDIKEVVHSFNFSKVFIYDREAINASDTSSTESVMLEFINKKNFCDEDLFFLVQATSPLTQTEDFDNALKQLKEEQADSLLTCVRTKAFFWNDNGSAINYNYMKRPRRQNFKVQLMENGSFYINSIKNILKDKNRLSGKITIFEMQAYQSIDIDTKEDWILAEQTMQTHSLYGELHC